MVGVCRLVATTRLSASQGIPKLDFDPQSRVERLKSTLGILMWFVVSTVIAYHIGILDQNPMLGTQKLFPVPKKSHLFNLHKNSKNKTL